MTKHNHTKSMGCCKSSSYREVPRYIGFPKKKKKKSKTSNNLTYHIKELEKEEEKVEVGK